jgi:hypothetical protein
MSSELTLIIPFGKTDPVEQLINGHVGHRIDLEAAAQIIAMHTSGRGPANLPYISPALFEVTRQEWHQQPETINNDDGDENPSAVEGIMNAWPDITLNVMAFALDERPFVTDDAVTVTKDLSTTYNEMIARAAEATEFLRIALVINTDREVAPAPEDGAEEYDLWDAVRHPDGGLGLLVIDGESESLVIQPVSLECTHFTPAIAA